MIPFERHVCVCCKLRETDSKLDKATDMLIIGYIKQAIMDAFWSWASSKIQKNASRAGQITDSYESIELSGPFVHRRDLPWKDYYEYEVAVNIFFHSRKSGKLNKEYVQFESMRKLRFTFSNFVGASPQANLTSLPLSDMTGR